MVKFPEAEARKLKNVFVCKNCKAKTRAPNMKITAGKISCRGCGQKVFRPVRKK